MINKKKKQFFYYVLALGFLMLIAGAITYPYKANSKSQDKKSQTEDSRGERKKETKLIRLVSPVGVARFIRIETLDRKFREEGEYTINLELKDNEETKEYLEKITNIIEDFKKREEYKEKRQFKHARLPWQKVRVNNSEGDATRDPGLTPDEVYMVKYRETGSFKSKGKTIKTKVSKFDQDGGIFTGIIPPNSLVKVSADIVPFNNYYGVGATLRLKAVQVIELNNDNKNLIAEDFGFISEKWSESSEIPTDPLPSIEEQETTTPDPSAIEIEITTE
jgi:hypothetical protein